MITQLRHAATLVFHQKENPQASHWGAMKMKTVLPRAQI